MFRIIMFAFKGRFIYYVEKKVNFRQGRLRKEKPQKAFYQVFRQ